MSFRIFSKILKISFANFQTATIRTSHFGKFLCLVHEFQIAMYGAIAARWNSIWKSLAADISIF